MLKHWHSMCFMVCPHTCQCRSWGDASSWRPCERALKRSAASSADGEAAQYRTVGLGTCTRPHGWCKTAWNADAHLLMPAKLPWQNCHGFSLSLNAVSLDDRVHFPWCSPMWKPLGRAGRKALLMTCCHIAVDIVARHGYSRCISYLDTNDQACNASARHSVPVAHF